MRRRKRTYPPKGGTEYHQMWRLVDGAVADMIRHHPEYISQGITHKAVRQSINKRVVGAIMAFITASRSFRGLPKGRVDPEKSGD